jgi:hypothetical protein
MSWFTKHIQIAAVLATLLVSSACNPQAMQSTNGLGVGGTGFQNPQGAPYTIGGDIRARGAGAADASGGALSAADKELAQGITELEVTRFAITNSGRKIDRFGISEIEVKLKTAAGALEFKGFLKSAGANRFQAFDLKTKTQSHSLDVEFNDEPNQRSSAGKLTLKKLDNRARPIAKTDIFTRGYSARSVVNVHPGQTLSPTNQIQLKFIKERAFAWVNNQVIMNGRAFYEVQLLSAGPTEAKPKEEKSQQETLKDRIEQYVYGKRIFTFAGEDVRTGDFPNTKAMRLTEGTSEPLEIFLVGNAENEDLRTFRVSIKGYEGSQKIRFDLRIERWDLEKVGLTRGFHGLSAESFFPIRYSRAKTTRFTETVDGFERYFDLPIVQRFIKEFTTAERPKGRLLDLLRALAAAAPFRPLLSAIFESYGVLPAASVVSIIESHFFTGGNFAIQTADTTDATGPFQLTWATAHDQKMRAYRNEAGALPPGDDERRYFVPSACGAARKLSQALDDYIKHDPALIFLAYYAGDAGASNRTQPVYPFVNGVEDTTRVLRYKYTFREIVRQNMGTTLELEYVAKALALYFVTGNPTAYKIAWKSDPSLKIPKGRIMPPQFINDPNCRYAIAALAQNGTIRNLQEGLASR